MKNTAWEQRQTWPEGEAAGELSDDSLDDVYLEHA